MRLFVGIEVSKDVRLTVSQIQAALSPALNRQGVRLVKPEKVHLTLLFLGNVDETKVSEILPLLDHAAKVGDFSIQLRELGVFPTERRPGVVWIGVDGGQQLLELQTVVTAALEPYTEKNDSRGYSPHLTLARISPASQKIGLALKPSVNRTARDICGEPVASEWKVSGIVLFQTMPDGSYLQLHRSPLGSA